MKKIIVVLVLTFFILPTSIYAQTFSFDPSGVEVASTGSEFSLFLESTAATNASNVHIIFNEDIIITNFVRANNTSLLYLSEECGDSFFTTNELCFSVASTGNVFGSREELGKITIKSATSEILNYEIGERSSVVVGGKELYLVESDLDQDSSSNESTTNPVSFPTQQDVSTDTDSENIGTTQLTVIVGLAAFVFISGGLYLFFKSK